MDKEEFDRRLSAALKSMRLGRLRLLASCAFFRPGSSSNGAGRIVNIHPSLLPKYRGLDTHARAIAAGDS